MQELLSNPHILHILPHRKGYPPSLESVSSKIAIFKCTNGDTIQIVDKNNSYSLSEWCWCIAYICKDNMRIVFISRKNIAERKYDPMSIGIRFTGNVVWAGIIAPIRDQHDQINYIDNFTPRGKGIQFQVPIDTLYEGLWMGDEEYGEGLLYTFDSWGSIKQCTHNSLTQERVCGKTVAKLKDEKSPSDNRKLFFPTFSDFNPNARLVLVAETIKALGGYEIWKTSCHPTEVEDVKELAKLHLNMRMGSLARAIEEEKKMIHPEVFDPNLVSLIFTRAHEEEEKISELKRNKLLKKEDKQIQNPLVTLPKLSSMSIVPRRVLHSPMLEYESSDGNSLFFRCNNGDTVELTDSSEYYSLPDWYWCAKYTYAAEKKMRIVFISRTKIQTEGTYEPEKFGIMHDNYPSAFSWVGEIKSIHSRSKRLNDIDKFLSNGRGIIFPSLNADTVYEGLWKNGNEYGAGLMHILDVYRTLAEYNHDPTTGKRVITGYYLYDPETGKKILDDTFQKLSDAQKNKYRKTKKFPTFANFDPILRLIMVAETRRTLGGYDAWKERCDPEEIKDVARLEAIHKKMREDSLVRMAEIEKTRYQNRPMDKFDSTWLKHWPDPKRAKQERDRIISEILELDNQEKQRKKKISPEEKNKEKKRIEAEKEKILKQHEENRKRKEKEKQKEINKQKQIVELEESRIKKLEKMRMREIRIQYEKEMLEKEKMGILSNANKKALYVAEMMEKDKSVLTKDEISVHDATTPTIPIDPFRCNVCDIREKKMVFLPCKHCFCLYCAAEMKECHICRSPIEQRVMFYMA